MIWVYVQFLIYGCIRYGLSVVYRTFLRDYQPIITLGQMGITWCRLSDIQSKRHATTQSSLRQTVFDLTYDRPITFAAFEAHMPSIELWLALGVAGGCLKTIKQAPHSGNAHPRIQQVRVSGQDHLMNALGLPGPGVLALMQTIQSSAVLTGVSCPIGISIGGNSLAEYQSVASAIVKQEPLLGLKQLYYELNISCPNTESGQTLHQSIQDIQSLLTHMRSETDRVIVIKVSPDASNQNLLDIASLATSFDKVTINAGNTQFRSCESVGLSNMDISIGGGGLSGPSLLARTLEMIQLFAPFKLPLIATGGIQSAKDIQLLQSHGASIVGMATQLVKNPFSVVSMHQQLIDLNR